MGMHITWYPHYFRGGLVYGHKPKPTTGLARNGHRHVWVRCLHHKGQILTHGHQDTVSAGDPHRPTDANASKCKGGIFDSSESLRRRFWTETTVTILKPGTTPAEYLTAHGVICQNMHQSTYSNIANRQTTLRFVVNGLHVHPLYKDSGRTIWLTGLPTSVRTLLERLL